MDGQLCGPTSDYVPNESIEDMTPYMYLSLSYMFYKTRHDI